jgi:hypothetical protein
MMLKPGSVVLNVNTLPVIGLPIMACGIDRRYCFMGLQDAAKLWEPNVLLGIRA